MLTVAAAIQAAAAETTLEEGHKLLEEAVARNRNCPDYGNEWD
ncbi:hypothetical protein GCM10009038_22550 [Salinicola rhizosphaerae]|uniref:Uncharacterized protein n=1 Tax=Salinicola rhizosphaerae TaxID=1443141 RepID=A0ABQ3E1U8_9GAMM|nr:hypothetical protein GCM10009038_22550 [Salinicola rhizosphaerae]